MIVSRQSGIALVQVLLISALLLLLVVQLSLTAKKSVDLAIQLKAKSQASLQAINQFSNAQYVLLTQQQGYSIAWNNGVVANYSGSPFMAEENVSVSLQDMSGLLSTSFFGLEWLNYVQRDNAKLETLKQWQGLTEGRGFASGKRNARLPYIEEINLLEGWQEQSHDHVTRLPTGFFNIAMAPVSLLLELYPEEVVLQIVELRTSGNFKRKDFNLIKGLEDSTPFPRSNFIQVNVEVQPTGDVKYLRSRIYDVQTGKSVPIVEIGIGTP